MCLNFLKAIAISDNIIISKMVFEGKNQISSRHSLLRASREPQAYSILYQICLAALSLVVLTI